MEGSVGTILAREAPPDVSCGNARVIPAQMGRLVLFGGW